MTDIAALIPHAGAMCLLDRLISWDAGKILCGATSHRSTANPLRHDGRLGAICGVEYAMQAAALHGALLDQGRRQPAGRIASMRDIVLHVDRLDIPDWGALRIEARLQHRDAMGLLYTFAVRAGDGRPLVDGRATIALPGCRP